MACGVQRYGCLGRQPRTHTIFFGIAQFNKPHRMYPKPPFLACGVLRYGCLGRHPRTHAIFFGVVQLIGAGDDHLMAIHIENGLGAHCAGATRRPTGEGGGIRLPAVAFLLGAKADRYRTPFIVHGTRFGPHLVCFLPTPAFQVPGKGRVYPS